MVAATAPVKDSEMTSTSSTVARTLRASTFIANRPTFRAV